MKATEKNNRIRRVVLPSQISRAFWSVQHAWHEQEVRLFVETRYVPDGTKLGIEIWEDAQEPAIPDAPVTVLKGDYAIQGDRFSIPYTIRWDQETLGKPLSLVTDRCLFYFLARIDRFRLAQRSTLIYVDVHSFRFSG